MVTEARVREIFDTFNKLYFNNELPQPNKIEFRFVKRYLGQFHWSGNYKSLYASSILRISTAYTMTDFEIEKVIIHEMIHSWQWVTGHCDHHGKYFKMKAAEINAKTNNKYKIARQTELVNSECLKDINKTFNGIAIVYVKTNDTVKYAAFCSKRSLRTFKKWMPTSSQVAEVHFYEAKGDNLLVYRKSVKRIHGYRLTQSIQNTFIREI
jgi:hypothetical protein